MSFAYSIASGRRGNIWKHCVFHWRLFGVEKLVAPFSQDMKIIKVTTSYVRNCYRLGDALVLELKFMQARAGVGV